jgi:hypothetical protein
MSKRKARKNAEQGTYAICISCGLILGLGLAPVFGSALATSILGLLLGGVAGYLLNHRKSNQKK